MPRASRENDSMRLPSFRNYLGKNGVGRYNKCVVTYEFYKEIALTVLIAGIIAVFLGGGIAWLAYDMNRHAVVIQKSLAEIQARKDGEGNLALLRGQAEQASGYVPFLVSILPEPDSLISLPREMTNRARLYGIDFSFAFGESVTGSTTTAGMIAYTASGKGDALKWLDFLRALESGSPLANVEKALFSSADGKEYEVKINGNIFSQ